jgi:hypothetical protein
MEAPPVWFARPPAPVRQTADSRYRRASYVAAGRCENATFLLNKKTGRYYKLDDVGTELWTLLRNPVGVDMQEIVHELSAIYEVAPQEIAEDVTALISKLIGYEVIDISSAPGRPC